MHDTNSNIPVVVHPPPARPRSNSQGVIVDCADVVVLKFLCQMVARASPGLMSSIVSRQKWLHLCSAAAESLAA